MTEDNTFRRTGTIYRGCLTCRKIENAKSHSNRGDRTEEYARTNARKKKLRELSNHDRSK